MQQSSRFLGVFVHPMDVQSEGMDAVFANLEMAGATAIATTPFLARPVAAGGERIPELHMDGYERVLARPLWNRRELRCEFFRAKPFSDELFSNLPYRPPGKNAPSDLDCSIPDRMLAEARRRGMRVYLQITPFVPPKVRTEDQPRYVDGTFPQPPQVALNACLNSPTARSYALALLLDAVRSSPEIDGLFLDWAEYGAYRLEDHFTCFCPHCKAQASASGLPWAEIVRDTEALWRWLHTLDSRRLEQAHRILGSPSALTELLTRFPGFLHLTRLKADAVVSFYSEARRLLDREGLGQVGLAARGWAPPWNRSSGMDYRRLSELCSELTPKLFTFDYCAMPRWYGETLKSWNPQLTEGEILAVLLNWMNLPDDRESRRFASYQIPGPDERHFPGMESYKDRLDEVLDQAGGRSPCRPFLHAYLPEPQWKRMIALSRDSGVDGIWVQMYGYLSDAKLRILRELWT